MKTENLNACPVKCPPVCRLALALFLTAVASFAPCRGVAASRAEGAPSQSFFKKILGGFSFGQRPAATLAPDGAPALDTLKASELQARVAADLRLVNDLRAGLQTVLDRARANTALSQPGGAPDTATVAAARQAWCAVCDGCLSLEVLTRTYDGFYRVKGHARGDAFLVRRGAFLAACRAGLEFMALIKNPALAAALDEPLPAFGLPAGFYSRLTGYYRTAAAPELTALGVLDRELSAAHNAAPRAAVAADARAIAALGHAPARDMTREAALTLLRHERPAFFSIQPAAAGAPGTATRPAGARDRLELLLGCLDPGDIVLLRHECRRVIMGQPGYWTQAALYAGTPAERKGYFNESTVKSWAIGLGQNDFEGLLRATGSNASTTEGVHQASPPPRLILARGAELIPLEMACEAGAIAVLRPRLSKLAKAQALLRAADRGEDAGAGSAGAEMIRQAYAPSQGGDGLRWSITKEFDQPLTHNDVAQVFDAALDGAEPQLDCLCFIDGPEAAAGVAAFRQSWRRPKWRIRIEDTLLPTVPLADPRRSIAWEVYNPSR